MIYIHEYKSDYIGLLRDPIYIGPKSGTITLKLSLLWFSLLKSRKPDFTFSSILKKRFAYMRALSSSSQTTV